MYRFHGRCLIIDHAIFMAKSFVGGCSVLTLHAHTISELGTSARATLKLYLAKLCDENFLGKYTRKIVVEHINGRELRSHDARLRSNRLICGRPVGVIVYMWPETCGCRTTPTLQFM